jgi:hypothetical protein
LYVAVRSRANVQEHLHWKTKADLREQLDKSMERTSDQIERQIERQGNRLSRQLDLLIKQSANRDDAKRPTFPHM